MPIKKAMQQLKGETFKLWIWCYLQPQPFQMKRELVAEWGIKKDSYYRGIAVLEELGYLIDMGSGNYQLITPTV